MRYKENIDKKIFLFFEIFPNKIGINFSSNYLKSRIILTYEKTYLEYSLTLKTYKCCRSAIISGYPAYNLAPDR